MDTYYSQRLRIIPYIKFTCLKVIILDFFIHWWPRGRGQHLSSCHFECDFNITQVLYKYNNGLNKKLIIHLYTQYHHMRVAELHTYFLFTNCFKVVPALWIGLCSRSLYLQKHFTLPHGIFQNIHKQKYIIHKQA